MGMLSAERMSDLIGMIYDSAIDSEQWPQTLEEICRTLHYASGGILLLDLQTSQHKFAYSYGLSPEWTKRYFEYSHKLSGFYSRAFSRDICIDGEPLRISTLMDRVGLPDRRIYDDWTEPQGVSEMVQTVVLRRSRRLAVFGTNRHRSAGDLTEDDVNIVRLLVPHIRRAVAIIDILDAKRIEAHTLAATLDNFTAGILVVADQGRILHANSAARGMLSQRAPIASIDGRLSVRDARAREELLRAVEFARANEAGIGASGIGVPLCDDRSAVAHVLPLARGNLRTRIAPQATAAVFVTQPDDSPSRDVSAVAANFGLVDATWAVFDANRHEVNWRSCGCLSACPAHSS
jgi:PAS domain-containing protein